MVQRRAVPTVVMYRVTARFVPRWHERSTVYNGCSACRLGPSSNNNNTTFTPLQQYNQPSYLRGIHKPTMFARNITSTARAASRLVARQAHTTPAKHSHNPVSHLFSPMADHELTSGDCLLPRGAHARRSLPPCRHGSRHVLLRRLLGLQAHPR